MINREATVLSSFFYFTGLEAAAKEVSIHWSGKSLGENGKKNVPEESGGYPFSEREYL